MKRMELGPQVSNEKSTARTLICDVKYKPGGKPFSCDSRKNKTDYYDSFASESGQKLWSYSPGD
jgi:hypothetical protein